MKVPFIREEKTLANGMRVILIQKKGFRKSLFMIGVPAGGMNILETDGNLEVDNPTGCAHYLEHQMFRLNGKDVTELLADQRAQTNAYTSYTETCYYVTTSGDPIEPLKTLIEFVQTLDISKQSVDKEKGIILSELHLYESQPSSRLFREMLKSLYHTYPLNLEILGTETDIRNMTVEHLENFYNRWYDPSNLVLCGVTGSDLDPIFETIEKMEEHFPSAITQKPQVRFEEEPEDVVKDKSLIEMDVEMPYAGIAVKLKSQKEIQKNLRTDFIVNLWLDSIFSTLNPAFQTWLDQRIVSQNCGAEADFSSTHAYILMYAQSEKPEEFLELATSILNEKPEITEEAYHSLIRQNLALCLRSLDSFDYLASEHIQGKMLGYDPLQTAEMIRSITIEEVRKVIADLDLSKRAVVEIMPPAQTGPITVKDEEIFETDLQEESE